eukprot:gene12666-biopygen2223
MPSVEYRNAAKHGEVQRVQAGRGPIASQKYFPAPTRRFQHGTDSPGSWPKRNTFEFSVTRNRGEQIGFDIINDLDSTGGRIIIKNVFVGGNLHRAAGIRPINMELIRIGNHALCKEDCSSLKGQLQRAVNAAGRCFTMEFRERRTRSRLYSSDSDLDDGTPARPSAAKWKPVENVRLERELRRHLVQKREESDVQRRTAPGAGARPPAPGAGLRPPAPGAGARPPAPTAPTEDGAIVDKLETLEAQRLDLISAIRTSKSGRTHAALMDELNCVEEDMRECRKSLAERFRRPDRFRIKERCPTPSPSPCVSSKDGDADMASESESAASDSGSDSSVTASVSASESKSAEQLFKPDVHGKKRQSGSFRRDKKNALKRARIAAGQG